jgi:hypothetical protein
MAKLTHSHQITEKRDFGKTVVNQLMQIEVDYNAEDESIEVLNVFIFQDGKFICEISKLLHKAEGSPLSAIIDSIEWAMIYKCTKKEQYMY